MDPKVRTVLMIIALVVQSIFVPINISYVIIDKGWIFIIEIIVVVLKISFIIDSYILVCSKTLSNKTCHLIFQVFGSIVVMVFLFFYGLMIYVSIIFHGKIPPEFIAVLLVDLISLIFCNICSYRIIQEIKEYDLIPQMNFPYYPSNVRFFNPVMEMRELPPQTNFMPKMLFPFMGNVQVPN